jgi:hypothetical protein
MAFEDDPVEMIGDENSKIRAEPVRAVNRAAPPAPIEPAPVAEKKPGSHPKVAIRGPRIAFEQSEQELIEARAELVAAQADLRIKEKAEGASLVEWIKLNPAPSQDAVFRSMIAAETAAKLARVAAGLPLVTAAIPTHNRSPIDTVAANRGRHAGGHAHKVGVPLRSSVVRR